MFLLSVAIFVFLLLNSNTRADHDEVITEEDLKAFEEALADIRRQSHNRVNTEASSASPTELNRGLSGRSKKLNAKAFQQTFPRKRARQRNHLRRLGVFLRKANSNKKHANQRRETLRKHVFNFRKRKRKPVDGKVIKKSGGGIGKRPQNDTKTSKERLTRFLFKAEDRFSQEKDIERAVLHALRETTTTSTIPPSTTALNMLKITPPRHRGEIGRRTTTRSPIEATSFSESTSTVAALEALIAALENIQPKEFDEDLFVDETTPFSTTASTTTTTKSTTTVTSTTTSTSTTTTTSPSTTSTAAITTTEPAITRKSRPRGSSFRISTPESSGPTPPPNSIAAEARRLSLEIESNFVDEAPAGPEPPASFGPLPPGSRGPPSGFAPPGAEPPSDFVVNELNEADDFLAVASKLQILRRKSTRLQ